MQQLCFRSVARRVFPLLVASAVRGEERRRPDFAAAFLPVSFLPPKWFAFEIAVLLPLKPAPGNLSSMVLRQSSDNKSARRLLATFLAAALSAAPLLAPTESLAANLVLSDADPLLLPP